MSKNNFKFLFNLILLLVVYILLGIFWIIMLNVYNMNSTVEKNHASIYFQETFKK